MEEKSSNEVPIDEIDSLCQGLRLKYDYEGSLHGVRQALGKTEEAFGTLGRLRGKRILDLGCGSYSSDTQYKNREQEPWFCRALLELGAKPVGVDIGQQLESEEFEHHQIDLRAIGSLNFLQNQSFDAVNMKYVPYLVGVKEVEKKPLQQEIEGQIKRLLKSGGKIINLTPAF